MYLAHACPPDRAAANILAAGCDTSATTLVLDSFTLMAGGRNELRPYGIYPCFLRKRSMRTRASSSLS